MIKADLSSIEVSAVSATTVAVFISMSGMLIAGRQMLQRALAMTPAAFSSLCQSSVRWNGFVALPIAVELYGDTGAAIVAIIMAWLVPLANAAARLSPIRPLLVLGITATTLVVAVICAAVPTAMNGFLHARQMGGDAPLQAAMTTLHTVMSFVTIPALIWLVQSIAGQ